jgi:hypothetical protein
LSDEYRKLEQIQSTLNDIKDILPTLRFDWAWLYILAGIWILSGWSGSKLDRWTDRVWYSMVHGANWNNVDIQKRPLDCDFSHSPLGDKGCHYKKSNFSFDDDDRRRLLQQASTDEDRSRLKNTPNSATVYWVKVPE